MKIKPCPFCGSKKVDICRTNANACWVECVQCFAHTSHNSKREKAISSWNKRRKVAGVATIQYDDEVEWH